MRERKTLNKALLRKVALKLRRLRHEKHYDQRHFINKTQCGTAACIAGWVNLMEGVPRARYRRVGLDIARGRLGLPKDSSAIGHWLFSALPEESWPTEYGLRWAAAKAGNSKERPSRIAADLLDAIADGKVKL